MGDLNCCRKLDNEEEKKFEKSKLYTSIKKPDDIKNLDFLILQEDTIINKNNNININDKNSLNENNNIYNNENDENKEEQSEKVKKIQQKYRSYHLKNKFQNEIKPKLFKKTNTFIEQFYQLCLQGGETSSDEDFNPDKWKEFYPEEEKFFLFNKGNTFPNQIRIKNAEDPENLEIYEGETNDKNMMHGFGTLTTPHYRFKGSWRNDKFSGWGRKSFRNGDVFEGKFVDGELNGKGIFKSKDNNSTYIGDFVNSKRNGVGELTTNKLHYVGEFKNDELSGKGVIDFLNEGNRYEGEFENNDINGKGIYKFKNGDVYEGEMKNGKMDGFGKFTYADGKIYEGEFINGIKQGKGKLISPQDKMYEGKFENGLPEGEGFYTIDGQTSKVLFSKGNFVKIIA